MYLPPPLDSKMVTNQSADRMRGTTIDSVSQDTVVAGLLTDSPAWTEGLPSFWSHSVELAAVPKAFGTP